LTALSSINSYYKFMFVRHPLDRTLSAFRDKFRRQANYLSRYGTRIIRRFRGANASAESLKRGHDVTLAEYVRFLLDPSMSRATRAERTDIHWATQTDLCRPCSIDYDFIGHYETLDDDADFVVQQLNLDPKAQFPHQYDADGKPKKSRHSTVSDDDFREAFAEVPPEDLAALKQLYANDYKLFGYS
jgi:Sulfotransferase family